jgi:demethylmenaquinone methyltransferase / 2-methoxy-6-polyprenyl-1,4-benzoquinol methylase
LETQNPTSEKFKSYYSGISKRYDIINRVFTLGMDRGWRSQAAHECLIASPTCFLDLACGTGDLAIAVSELSKKNRYIVVRGVDFSQPMLKKASARAASKYLKIDFCCGDAAAIPFAGSSFDCVGTAFAFRNLTYHNPNSGKYISEIIRVLRPGGRLVIVESSRPANRVIGKIDRTYLRTFVYPIGWLISGNRGAYDYLTASAADYYTAEELRDLLLKSGFRQVYFKGLFCGAAAIHVAIK